MIRTPWKSAANPEPGHQYVALLSYLPLKKFRAIPRFLSYTLRIQKQLESARGLIGYSLHAQPLKLKFWTLSVWEDDKALMEFVRNLPHGEVMNKLAPDMGETRFNRWFIDGSDIPPAWKEAKKSGSGAGRTWPD